MVDNFLPNVLNIAWTTLPTAHCLLRVKVALVVVVRRQVGTTGKRLGTE